VGATSKVAKAKSEGIFGKPMYDFILEFNINYGYIWDRLEVILL
jgi:hypothetical protein